LCKGAESQHTKRVIRPNACLTMQRNFVIIATSALTSHVAAAPASVRNGVTHENTLAAARFNESLAQGRMSKKSGTTVRKALSTMPVYEQERFLQSVAKMQETGLGGAFEINARYHGYSRPSEFQCAHGVENFPHWHRIQLLSFETALQDAHEALYGNRSIGIPYWNWEDDSITKIFDPSMKDLMDSLSTKEVMQNLLGPGPIRGDSKVKKIWSQGFKHDSDAKIFGRGDWKGIRADMNSWMRRMSGMRHAAAAVQLENAHNGVHIVGNVPMNALSSAPYSIYFWTHHCNIDRMWEGYLAAREAKDGSRDVVEAEMTPSVYAKELSPYKMADGVTPWTSAGTFSAAALGYEYEHVPTEEDAAPIDPSAPRVCKNSKKFCPSVKDGVCDDGGPGSTYADCPIGTDCKDCGASNRPAASTMVRGQSTASAATDATIAFGKDDACTVDLSQPSFMLHVFLYEADTPQTPLPTVESELPEVGKAYGNATYAGSMSLFGGMTPDDMTASLKPSMLYLPVKLPLNSVPEEFEVVMLYQEAAGNDDVDDPPLLAKPDFFVETAGCGGKPEPDASYVSFTLE
jgi:hypothetical protein